MSERFTFSKQERLISRTDIQNLFDSGNSLFFHPFKVVWDENKSEEHKFPAKVLISVPKRLHKTAVARNRVKRLFRESYRKNKHILYSELLDKNLVIDVSFIYISKEIQTYDQIEKSVITNIKNLIKSINEYILKKD